MNPVAHVNAENKHIYVHHYSMEVNRKFNLDNSKSTWIEKNEISHYDEV